MTLLMKIAFLYAITVISVLLWVFNDVTYSIMSFDAFVFSEYRVVIVYIISSLVLVISILRFSKGYTKLTVPLLTYIISLYVAPFVANSPYLIHRDVYLHNSYSLLIVESGRIPIDENRWDVYSFPGAFLFYAIFMVTTNINFYFSGLILTIIWPLLFATLPLLALQRLKNSNMHPKTLLLSISMILIPYALASYAPTPSFFHRYHFAFFLTAIWLFLFLRQNNRPQREDFVALHLLYFAIVFTHPYFSIFIALFLLVHIFMFTIVGKLKKTITAPLISVVIGLASHMIYLASPRLVIEAYTLVVIRPNIQISNFVEQTLPVYIQVPSPILEYLAVAERYIWRAVVLGIAILTLINTLIDTTRRNVVALTIALPLIFTATTLSIPLIYSFLWWERSISILGLAVFFSMLVLLSGSTVISKNKYFKNLLLILILAGIIFTPLNKYERSLLESTWRSPAESEALQFLSSNTAQNKIYAGYGTGVILTFYRLFVNTQLNVITIYDDIKGYLKIDPKTLNSLYIFSLTDPDYRYISKEATYLLTDKSLIFENELYFIII